MERPQLQSISKIGGGKEGRCFCRALSFLPRPRSDSDGRRRSVALSRPGQMLADAAAEVTAAVRSARAVERSLFLSRWCQAGSDSGKLASLFAAVGEARD